jgi:tetratricopeptide (TPR) repeat protein
MQPNHPRYASQLLAIEVGSHRIYEANRQTKHLDQAIQLYEVALDCAQKASNRLYPLLRLGMGYQDRYKIKGEEADLELATHRLQEAVDHRPARPKFRARALHLLGKGYLHRHRRRMRSTDLDRALQHLQEALDLTSMENRDRGHQLHSLGDGYRDKDNMTRTMSDLELAIQLLQAALDYSKCHRRHDRDRHQSLAAAYRDRFKHTRDIDDLDTALRHLETAEFHSLDSSLHLNHALGVAYHDKFETSGVIGRLLKALQNLQRVWEFGPADHPLRPMWLQDIGLGCLARYRRTGAAADLEMANQRFQEALDATSTDHPDRPSRLDALAAGFRDKYKRTGAMADLDTAIRRSQEALDITPADYPDRASRLLDVGQGYRDRYQVTKKIEDLETSIDRFGEATKAINIRPVYQAVVFRLRQCVGEALVTRYRRTRFEPDLTLSIAYLSSGLPWDDVLQEGLSYSLGVAHAEGFAAVGLMVHHKMSIIQLEHALGDTLSPITKRLEAGKMLLAQCASMLQSPVMLILSALSEQVANCKDLQGARQNPRQETQS